MKPILALAAPLAMLAIAAAPALSAPCKEGKGSQVKCTPKGATRLGAAAVDGNVRKDAAGKCHVVHAAPGQTPGQEMPCPR